MQRWLSAFALLVVGGGLLASDDKPAGDKTSAKTQVTSLWLRKPKAARPGEFVFNPPAVNLEVAVTLPGKFILLLDNKASKLDGFTDDKDNNLHKEEKNPFGGSIPWVSFVSPAPDGQSINTTLMASNMPGKGAQKIHVKASLVFKCGADEKSTDKKEIALKKDEEATVGDFTVKVASTAAFGSQIQVLSDELNVKNAEFFDAEGKPIRLFGPPGRHASPAAPGGKAKHVTSYFVSLKGDKFSVKVNYFTKTESVTVPLDLKVGLDLE